MEQALIYIRVSTEEQAKDGRFSLTTQRNSCEKFITESKRFVLANNGVYEDAGRSATNMNRPALQNLIVRVTEDKTIKAVLVLDTDRLARNVTDHLAIKSILKKYGAELISVSQPDMKDNPEGNLQDIIVAAINQFQSQLTARKTIKSMVSRFHDGWWPTRAPIGYKNVAAPDNPNKRIVVLDEVKAPLLKEFLTSYSTGRYAILELVDEMYKKGLTSHYGKKLSPSNAFRLIQNPFFYGLMDWRGEKKMGNHPPIISKELFDRNQQVRIEHNHSACRRRKYAFLLRGFVYSAITGLRFTAENHEKTKNKSYYRPYSKHGIRPAEDDRFVLVHDLEEQVEKCFERISFPEEFINKIINKVKEVHRSKKQSVDRDKALLERNKTVLESKLHIAEEKLISGVLSDADFSRIRTGLLEQISNISTQIVALEQSKEVQIDVIQKVLLLTRNIAEAYKKAPFELQRLYLSLFWERFEVSDRVIVNAVPTRIIRELVGIGSINLRQNPTKGNKIEQFSPAVKITNLRGG